MKDALIEYIKKDKCDEIYTPAYAVKPLLRFIPKEYIIWECTDFGESNITKVLKENGYKVITTHIDAFDFLKDEPTFEYDCIITNPPYSLKDEFLSRCFELNKPFALLLPLTALEGVKRGKMFKKHYINLLVFNKRINFLNQKKNNWFNTSWFCYGLPMVLQLNFIDIDDYKDGDINA